MATSVLDASALMALYQGESGCEIVAQAVEDGAAISTVNLSEVVSKLNELGTPEGVIRDAINVLRLDIVNFDAESAYEVGALRSMTKHAGLSLGDRACLALAQHLTLPALTLKQLEGIDVDEETQQAIEDWHYWVDRGHEL